MLPLTPPKLGRYEILDEIGKGAMGVVYLAKDPLIGRLVALKTFRIGYSVKDHEMEQFRVRFMREAQSAGILSHPNIVTIHDVMEKTEEGMAFIAMEYVRGTTLKAMLQSDQALSLGFVVDIIAQVAEALDYAHSHRVIHRDVKPANILITADNRVKITDFGIARLDTSNLTQEGQLLGTPNYMAPEQIQGKEVDHRADLFALGVVLYEMLTRHKPFQGENLTVVSHRIVYDQFTPPRDYARDMPPGLEPILDRALDKDPARRYQRAKDMAEDLRRVLAGSRDDLNETLSIASWAPGTGPGGSGGIPPPPPGPAGGGTTTAASPAGAGARPPAPSAASAPAKPAAAKGPKPPLSFKKIGLYAALAALVVVLGVAAMKLGKAWTGPAATATPETPEAQYKRMAQSGEDQFKAGQYDLAAESFSGAVAVAPNQDLRDYANTRLQMARQKKAELVASATNQTRIEVLLAEGDKAIADGRYDNALDATGQILAIDPVNVEAQRIKADAEKGLAQLRGKAKPRAAPTPTPARPQVAATPPPVPSPAVEEPVRAAENLSPRLRVAFQSAGLEASVQVRIGSRVVKNWKFLGERGGILRKKLKPFSASPEILELPAGTESISVLVAPTNKPARTQPLNLTGGATAVLQVRVNEAGEVSFN